MSDCLFCKIAVNEIASTRIYEDDVIYAIMDIFPESKGHFLIIPKKHGDNIFEIDDDILSHVIKTSKYLAKVAKDALNADGIRIAQFNGSSAGQTVFHYHMHVIPCYNNSKSSEHAKVEADKENIEKYANAIKEKLKLW